MPAVEIASVLDLFALPIPEFVEASYGRMLGRSPDSAEMQERCGALRAGLGRAEFLARLGHSAEFLERHNGAARDQSDGAFLEEVYQRYLGRQIDPQGIEGHLRLLARGKSRKHVVRRIANSREARLKRTFWFELDELLTGERAERHWFKRWFGKHQRRERRRNQMIEVVLIRPPVGGRVGVDVAGMTALCQLDLRADPFGILGPDARRILMRARQSAAGRP